MRSKPPDAGVSALIFLKCNDMSCVWHACTSTSTRPNCCHCKHETINRVWAFISVSNIFVFGSKRRFVQELHLYSQILCSYLRVMYWYSYLYSQLVKGGSRVGERGEGAKGWGLGRGLCPLPRKFFEFLSRNGAFLCIMLMTGGGGHGPRPLDPPLQLVYSKHLC